MIGNNRKAVPAKACAQIARKACRVIGLSRE
jgi:hypothetical protein